MYNVEQIITNLNAKYPNAIQTFGGAIRAYEFAEKSDLERFTGYIPHVAVRAAHCQWHEGIEGALNRFCHMCLIDPMLIEVYLGVSFKEIEIYTKEMML